MVKTEPYQSQTFSKLSTPTKLLPYKTRNVLDKTGTMLYTELSLHLTCFSALLRSIYNGCGGQRPSLNLWCVMREAGSVGPLLSRWILRVAVTATESWNGKQTTYLNIYFLCHHYHLSIVRVGSFSMISRAIMVKLDEKFRLVLDYSPTNYFF